MRPIARGRREHGSKSSPRKIFITLETQNFCGLQNDPCQIICLFLEGGVRSNSGAASTGRKGGSI